ncbi:class I fructose-bisphosphate aldolase [Ferrovum myxofaciens]|jgi:fructose-bisphosphate aldolase class I|uniref:fructose-bisphosphate aldolase n=1 Tax=mine drainage metagenome TaxID=410659 RepID=A0A3P3ZRX7_9ZZZZ|nr:class I fructose-bisphosphate aldolase [Ferrovum myxofaciens]MBU6993752.1 fructose-bisphosphate aldolase class I [Ferrovum myxofaciens]QKE40476.1 MAG: fructose-bisphosphate aldolase class I [Ferrovum myxofaciens]
MTIADELQATIEQMVQPGKGILAADESHLTIAKRFAAIKVESTEENRRVYRALLFTTPGIEDYISGVIQFEETLDQTSDDDILLPEVLARRGIVPGIKVDKGKGPLALSPGDLITYGLDGLAERLQHCKSQGARFAKWRDVYQISGHNPTSLAISANAEMLARYSAVCQELGIVPIVEPEVLIDGDHSLARCAEVIEAVQKEIFHALHRHHVVLEHIILKPSMVLPGKDHSVRASPEEIAAATLRVFRRTVPAAVPGINFLSGGLSPEQATANLNAMNVGDAPWLLSFSYGRALQQPVLQAWQGKAENVGAAQQALLKRARLNGAAQRGEYQESMENTA